MAISKTEGKILRRLTGNEYTGLSAEEVLEFHETQEREINAVRNLQKVGLVETRKVDGFLQVVLAGDISDCSIEKLAEK